jgi:hypothetical protein
LKHTTTVQLYAPNCTGLIVTLAAKSD